jgi:hypothetical protein
MIIDHYSHTRFLTNTNSLNRKPNTGLMSRDHDYILTDQERQELLTAVEGDGVSTGANPVRYGSPDRRNDPHRDGEGFEFKSNRI